MATNTTIALPATQVKILDTGIFDISLKPVLPAVANGDRIVLFTFPCAFRMTSLHLKVSNGLGAAATLKLQKNSAAVYTDISIATTAATAGVVTAATIGPVDFAAGDTVELLVGGGALTGGVAGTEVDILGQRP